MNKLSIFGIDGGSLALIQKYRDKLPTFNHILEYGSYGILESTVPALTSPAWPCLFTGKNPAQLGMFDFVSLNQHSRPFNSNDYHNSTIWKIAQDQGKKVCVFNVPFTYPPHDIKMICGIPRIYGQSFAYPPELETKLKSMNYSAFPPIKLTTKGKEKEYWNTFEDTLNKRKKVLEYLLQEDHDLFIMVEFVSDAVHHYYWKYLNGGKYEDVFLKLYIKLDYMLTLLLGSSERLIIVSDHGFQGCKGAFHVNRWLIENGYLTLKKDYKHKSLLQKITNLGLNIIPPNITSQAIQMLPLSLTKRLSFWQDVSNQIDYMLNVIDWPKTKAFALGTTGSIFINREDKWRHGTVSREDYSSVCAEIKSKLIIIKSPDGQHNQFRVHSKYEVYSGPFFDDAPDLLFVANGWYPTAVELTDQVWAEMNIEGSGTHSRDGLIMAYGKDAEKGEIKDAKIYDIFPTMKKYFGLN